MCWQLYSHSVCWASLCRAARDLEGEVREVYTMVRVIHLENTKTKEVRKAGKYTHAHMHTQGLRLQGCKKKPVKRC